MNYTKPIPEKEYRYAEITNRNFYKFLKERREMKRYKLLKDIPTHRAGTIFELRNEGLYDPKLRQYLYSMKSVDCFDMVGEWFEEVKESKFYKPNLGEEYYCIKSDGRVKTTIHISIDNPDTTAGIGNCFKTKEDAEKTVEKLKALRRLREKGLKFCYHEWNYEDGNNLPIHAKLPWNDYGPEEYDPILKDLNLLFKEESEDEN